MTFKSLTKNESKARTNNTQADQFLVQVNDLNERAIAKIKAQKHKEALTYLQKAEKMLEVGTWC